MRLLAISGRLYLKAVWAKHVLAKPVKALANADCRYSRVSKSGASHFHSNLAAAKIARRPATPQRRAFHPPR